MSRAFKKENEIVIPDDIDLTPGFEIILVVCTLAFILNYKRKKQV